MKLLAFMLLASALILPSCEDEKLDEYGGYYDEKIQVYRYTKVNRNAKSVKGLVRPFPGKKQLIDAQIIKLSGNLIWMLIEDRNVYTLLSQDVDINFKNEKNSWIAISLEGISFNPLATKSKKLNKQKNAKIAHIINKITKNKELSLIFEMKAAGRVLSGVLFLPNADVKDLSKSLNYWIIKNGLSPYILPKKQRDIIPEFIKAEDIARKNKSGIW
ncbi:MAG: thermonuclease family protein [SAR324 cluster bacterium]|nr:thermonuclease family protein [SAR324 cluster bacterium]